MDTLVIPGGQGTRQALEDEALINWIRRAAKRSRRVTSVCTGAFVLAEAGPARRPQGHHALEACAALARRYPAVAVEDDPIFVRDGNVYTSAGVTAGMDLALALVEEDHGHDAALGSPATSSCSCAARGAGAVQRGPGPPGGRAPPLRDLQAWIADHPTATSRSRPSRRGPT